MTAVTSSHLEWRVGLSDTILKGTHPRTIHARFGLIWFSGFRGEVLNVIFYQNMSSSLTFILGFSVKFFFQPIYTDYANWTYFDKRSHLKLLL
jgi:hypothetical protein